MFDPKAFLETSTTEANDTKIVPVPVGEYMAIISKVEARPWQSRTDSSKAGLALDITWDIDDQGVRQLLGRDTVTCKQGIMLDLTESGGLDMGKGRNVSLGRVREAVGLNIPGVPFSPMQLAGRGPAKVKVEHRVDGENIYAEVKQVAKL
jgi:hypothetical protein